MIRARSSHSLALVAALGAASSACRPRQIVASEEKVTNGVVDVGEKLGFAVMLEIPAVKEGIVHKCTGTIMTDETVLTAAHCLREYVDLHVSGYINVSNALNPVTAVKAAGKWLSRTCLPAPPVPGEDLLEGCVAGLVRVHTAWQQPLPQGVAPGKGKVTDEPPENDLALVTFPGHPFAAIPAPLLVNGCTPTGQCPPSEAPKPIHADVNNRVLIAGYGATNLTATKAAPGAPAPVGQDSIQTTANGTTYNVAIAGGGTRRVGVNTIADVQAMGAFSGLDGMLTLNSSLGNIPGKPGDVAGTGQGDSGGPLLVVGGASDVLSGPQVVTDVVADALSKPLLFAGVTHGFALGVDEGGNAWGMHAYFVDPFIPENADWINKATADRSPPLHFPSSLPRHIAPRPSPETAPVIVPVFGRCGCVASNNACNVIKNGVAVMKIKGGDASTGCNATCNDRSHLASELAAIAPGGCNY